MGADGGVRGAAIGTLSVYGKDGVREGVMSGKWRGRGGGNKCRNKGRKEKE